MVLPQFLGIFSKVNTNTAMTILEAYTSPDAFLAASRDDIIASMRSTARFGAFYLSDKCDAIINASKFTKVFGHSVSSNFKRIKIYIRFIRQYNAEISSILEDIHSLVSTNQGTRDYYFKKVNQKENGSCRSSNT
ncbi:hypothetical protein [Lacrimispora indolis]|uniref:hypothetical protein n=1 Tax=Lacrimispora indolis TaxID=69825 RepID=UPI0004026B6C|nr:hypothetical protein [[Clostridium] methoxybenzovorans]